MVRRAFVPLNISLAIVIRLTERSITGDHFSHGSRNNTWSFLDLILFSDPRGKKTTWRISADSVRIADQTDAQVASPGRPLRYNTAGRVGVYDHSPLLLEIEPVQKQ
jgi:hypothetical protein